MVLDGMGLFFCFFEFGDYGVAELLGLVGELGGDADLLGVASELDEVGEHLLIAGEGFVLELGCGGAVEQMGHGDAHGGVVLDDLGELLELVVLLAGEVVLLGVDGDEVELVAVEAYGVGQGASGRGGHLDEEVAEGFPHRFHVAKFGVVEIAADGHVEYDLAVFVLEHVECGLEGQMERRIDVVTAGTHFGTIEVDAILSVELAVADGVLAGEGEGAFFERLAEEFDAIGGDVGELEVLDVEHQVLVALDVVEGACPIDLRMSAVGQVGKDAGAVFAAEREVLGLDADVGEGEVERIVEGVVAVGELSVVDVESAHMELHGLGGLRLDGVGLRLGLGGALGNIEEALEVGAILVEVEAGVESCKFDRGDVEEVVVENDLIDHDCKFGECEHGGVLVVSDVDVEEVEVAGNFHLHDFAEVAVDMEVGVEQTFELAHIHGVGEVAADVADSKVVETQVDVEVVALEVELEVGGQGATVGKLEREAGVGALLAAEIDAGHIDVEVFEVPFALALKVGVVDFPVGETDVVDANLPGFALFFDLLFVFLFGTKMVEDGAEVEAVAVLEHSHAEVGEGDVVDINLVA